MKCKFCHRSFKKARSNQVTCGRPECKASNLQAAYRAWQRRKAAQKHQVPSVTDGYTPVKVVTVWRTGRSETSLEYVKKFVGNRDSATTGFVRKSVDEIREEVER